MVPTPTQEPEYPTLKPLRRWLLVTAIATSTVVIMWPLLDLYAHARFTTPGVWWMFLLVSLAGWISYVLNIGQQTLLTRIEQHIDQRCDRMQAAIEDYGDERETSGHVLATKFRGNGNHPVRQLHTVE